MTADSPPEQLLADHQGFQIVRRENGIIFIHRRTRSVAIAAMIAFGLSAICGVAALIFTATALSGSTRDRDQLVAVVPITMIALVAALIGRFALRSYRARQQGSGERLIVRDSALLSAAGEQLARTADVSCETSIDLTDGMGGFRFARILSLRWPGGSRPIYKSYDQSELATLRNELANVGIRST